MKARRGFSVELTRDNGTTFLALTGGGILPFVHVQRKWAVEYKRQMQDWGFKARVVPVKFTDPQPSQKPRKPAPSFSAKSTRLRCHHTEP